MRLVPLLDGQHTIDEIVFELRDSIRAADVYYTIMLLEARGYLEDNSSLTGPSSFAMRELREQKFADITLAPITRGAALVMPEDEHRDQFIALLHNHNVCVDDDSRYSIIVAKEYLSLGVLRQLHCGSTKSFLLLKPYTPLVMIGPVIATGRGGCLSCLQYRLALNRPADQFLSEVGYSSLSGESGGWSEEYRLLGMQLAAKEAAKWLESDGPSVLETSICTVDLRSGERTQHPFIRRPQCPDCGDDSLARNPARILLSRMRRVQASSNYHVDKPKSTYRRLERHISPLTGVVRSVTRVDTPGAAGVHNYTVGHVSRGRHHSIESLRLATRDQSGGKGKTDEQARTSGLCEALERFSAVHDGDSPDVHASYASLDRRAISPNGLLLFSETQFEHRFEWNAAQRGHFQFVPEPYDEQTVIDWKEVWSLTRDEPCLVPSSYCYYGYEGVGTDFCKADSNGLAAGNTLEEAILQGLLELVERDAVAIWWYNRTQQPGVDLSSFADPYLDEMQVYYRSLGRDLWVLDLTHDLGIPTFVGISRLVDAPTEDILLGFGAHFDAQVAVTRAILEVNQSLPAALRSRAERERQLLPDFGDVLDWWDQATIEEHPYLVPASDLTTKSASDFPCYESVDLAEMIEEYVRRLAGLGLETLVLDMTRPDIELPVARVMVPGLRHFWRRLAPGRLYDVPVATGRLPAALGEMQLNPVSLFL